MTKCNKNFAVDKTMNATNDFTNSTNALFTFAFWSGIILLSRDLAKKIFIFLQKAANLFALFDTI